MNQLMEYFVRGGSLMWVLLAFSIVGVAVIVERSVVYLWYGLKPDAWLAGVLEMLRSGRIEAAEQAAKTCRHPVARVVETYLENRSRPSKVRMDNIRRVGSLELENVEKRLRILAAISHLSPLVGLLGTVVGMVVAFATIQQLQGAAKPADLAGGIWEALLTTVFGLLVAIPCMAAFHGFESHADKISRRMEWAVTALDDVFSALDATEETAALFPAEGREDWTSVG
jgi:biopolymer transport protein ExbB